MQNPSKKAYQAALRYLTRRDYSCFEIEQKLLTKAHPYDEIKLAISTLVRTGLINDERVAENFVRSRSLRGYGPKRISRELEARGIDPEIIAEKLKATDEAWLTEAHKVWKKRFKGELPTDYKNKAKQMRFLLYRGFTSKQIEAVFSCSLSEEG